MELELRGKRALVTGSTSGNGEAIAKALAREGVRVLVHGVRAPGEQERLTRVLDELPSGAIGHLADLSTDEDADHLAGFATRELGGVDILVNNAGVYPSHTWDDATPDEWVARYNVNVVSMVRLIRALLPQMKELRWGRIINIGSTLGWQPTARVPEYNATKAAVTTLGLSLATELNRTGITVTTVSPGLILTQSLTARYTEQGVSDDQMEEFILTNVLDNPTGRGGRPEDVAYVVAIIASPKAGFLNGCNIRVDGGSTMCVN
jgi:3-oxoacyl-[acyl-carrier protein] reductase